MAELKYDEYGRLLFTEKMKKEYTILAPQMAPIHFDLIKEAFLHEGYNFEILQNSNYDLIHEGLKYVHNDTCIPALLVIGQMIDGIKNGNYDVNKIALIITQTGGGCRASNYIHLLRQALSKAGMSQVPVISLSPGLEKNPGFKLSLSLGRKAINALYLGDVLMQLINESKPYEVRKGSTIELYNTINSELQLDMHKKSSKKWSWCESRIKDIVERFDSLDVDKSVKKPKVGVVGEIYVKYSPLGNNNLEAFLEDEGVEIIVPPMIDFMIFKMDYRRLEVDLYGGKRKKKILVNLGISWFESKKNKINKYLSKSKFREMASFDHLMELVKDYSHRGNRMGEGWLLTAEMLELIEIGCPNIVCCQPFGCLPNHISGKGMFKKIKSNHPEANIVPIDYDASSSEVNQINRIKLMLTNAYKNL